MSICFFAFCHFSSYISQTLRHASHHHRSRPQSSYSTATPRQPHSAARGPTRGVQAPPRPRERPPPGLHSGMGLLSMRRSWPRPKAVRRLHRTGGASRSRRSHGRRSLQPPGSDVTRLPAAIGAGGKPFGLSKLAFTRGRCRREGATSYSLRAVYPAYSAPTPSPSTTPHPPRHHVAVRGAAQRWLHPRSHSMCWRG